VIKVLTWWNLTVKLVTDVFAVMESFASRYAAVVVFITLSALQSSL